MKTASTKSGWLYTSARILLALIFIPSAFISFFIPPSEMGISPEASRIVENLWATGYLMHIVKGIELVAGLTFLTNRFVKLGLVLITPIILNIFLLAAFTSPNGMIMGFVLVGLVGFLASTHFYAFKPILTMK
ncbi:hypothetical protein [Pararhodonellum marinum]|uniref:hypothetical protein n=1 Tax=Pararhodonellum marinum TaxID=2755358 RepID=UPI00188FC6F1|nr:hypothetical protein [Pararhodonellum marinum]